MDGIKLSFSDRSLDILRGPAGAFDFETDLRNLRGQFIPKCLVPDQRFLGVIKRCFARLVQKDTIVEARASVAFEVLAVGVGAENQPAAIKSDAFAGIRKNRPEFADPVAYVRSIRRGSRLERLQKQ